MPIELKDILPARTAQEHREIRKSKATRKKMLEYKHDTQGRLMAQEYVRNGMNYARAVASVGIKNPQSQNSINYLNPAVQESFFDELANLVRTSDVDRDRALQILWTMVNTSLLDFVDNNGDFLPVAELKKLPRLLQLCLTKIKVERREEPIFEGTGKKRHMLLDENGRPYLRRIEYVHIEIPERMAAINQLAQLMKWVGPAIQVNNFNFGQFMADADSRADNAKVVYANVEQQKRLESER